MEPGLTLREDRRHPANCNPAFSLIELLMVVAIIAIMAVLGSTAFSGISRGTRLTAAARLIQSEISLARQQAVTFHQEVEVRLFQTRKSGTNEWNGIQLFMAHSPGGWSPLRRASVLEDGVIMDEARSKLLNAAPVSGSTNFGSHGVQSYRGFRFRSGGNTEPDLTTTNNTLLLRNAVPGQPDPDNFIVVEISPVNGRVTTYQP